MVTAALATFPKKTGTGVDGWNPRVWLQLSPHMLERLAALLRLWENNPQVPINLLTMVVFLGKPTGG
eukprot:10528003-Prorocentrum_lima.AAC.1